MNYRALGNTGIQVSEIGFGCWQLGNQNDWNGGDEQSSIALVHHALANGCNLFDTAPPYNMGQSETLLGQALKGQRQKAVICSKFGYSPDWQCDFSAKGLILSIEDSLKRLQTDYIDVLLMHSPPADQLLREETYLALDKLKAQGKIRAYGASVDSAQEMQLLMENTQSQVFELFFNILFQDVSSAFDQAQQQGIGLLAKVPLDSGWLSGKYDQHSQFTGVRSRWSKGQIKQRATLVNKVQTILGDIPVSEAAFAFILKHPAISSILPGCCNIKQFTQNQHASNTQLSEQAFIALQLLWQQQIKVLNLSW